MVFAEDNTVYGSFTSAGVPRNLELGFVPTHVKLWNATQMSSTANPGVMKQAEYLKYMADGSAFLLKNTAGAATDESSVTTSNGFTPYDGVGEELGAATSGTGSIDQASPAQVSITSHGFSTGDVVRLYRTTGMLQIAGLDFVITRTGTGTFTLDGLDSSGFAAAATAVTARRLNVPLGWSPQNRIITKVSAANPGVVTTATAHGFSTNDKVRLLFPAESATVWGMSQLNGMIVTVTVVSATTFSIGVDTSSFTAFAFPTSAVAATGVSFAQAVPVGQTGQTLTDATNNTAFQGIKLGTSVCGAASDVIYYQASRAAVTSGT
jgi:hypothetical protein